MNCLYRVDLGPYLESPTSGRAAHDCAIIAEALREDGAVIVRDRRFSQKLDREYMGMMLRYFRQSQELKQNDCHPELHHQIGWTPSFTERAYDRRRQIALLNIRPEEMPHLDFKADPKERFFAPFAIERCPGISLFQYQNAPPVIPNGFYNWLETSEAWGRMMLDSILTTVEMAAVGFYLPPRSFYNMLRYGQHLVAPTGTNLDLHGWPNTVLAGLHDDLNLASGHGASNYPGLFIWTRHGRRLQVKLPPGEILIQAGQQMQHLTGGEVLAGLHEVVAVEDLDLSRDHAAGLVPWRVSRTLFAECFPDLILAPIGHFATPEALEKYPPMTVGDQVMRELNLIGLASK